MQAATVHAQPPEPTISSSDVLALVADSVICADDHGRILFLNRSAERAFGYSASEVVGQPVEMLLPPRFRAEHADQVKSFARQGGAASRLMGHRREVCGQRKNGEEFAAEATVSRHRVHDRVILTVAVRDVTNRKALEEQRDAIAREADHRVRNLLSVVGSLVELSSRGATSIGEFKDSLIERLAALARTQNALGRGLGQCVTLHELLRAELGQYRAADAINVDIKGPPISLDPSAAQSLALVFHELATNSVKYGALRDPSGRVTVTFAYRGTEDSEISIEWRETGGPVVQPPMRQGFGTLLLKQIVERAFQGQVALEFLPEGLICSMTLPRERAEEPGQAV